MFEKVLKDVWLLKKIIDFNLLQNAPTKTLYSERNIFREYLKSIFVVKKEKKKTLLFIHTLVKEETRQKPTLFFEYILYSLFSLDIRFLLAQYLRKLWKHNRAIHTQMQDYPANRKSALGNFRESWIR